MSHDKSMHPRDPIEDQRHAEVIQHLKELDLGLEMLNETLVRLEEHIRALNKKAFFVLNRTWPTEWEAFGGKLFMVSTDLS